MSCRFTDRALLAASSRVLPRGRWSCFLVKPDTLLRRDHRRRPASPSTRSGYGAWTCCSCIELDTRPVHLAGVTANPGGAWVAQQARNLLLVMGERGRRVRFLLRDRDAKCCRSFDDVFRSADAEVLLTPVQAPTANAYTASIPGRFRAHPGPVGR